jgi:hypothetical protein
MSFVRAVLVGAVIAAAMILAVRHVPVEQQMAHAEPAISEDALRAYGLRQIAVDALKAKVEPPMVLPTLEPFQPAPPPVEPQPSPKVEPQTAPPPTMVAMRSRSREYNICSRFGMHKVQIDRWRWHCRR